MNVKEIVADIKAKKPEIKSLLFVGCGASMSEMFPAKYFMDRNAKTLRSSIHTANEFNYSTPVSCDETAIVVTCSLSGGTPEAVAATKRQGSSVLPLSVLQLIRNLRLQPMLNIRSSTDSMRTMQRRWRRWGMSSHLHAKCSTLTKAMRIMTRCRTALQRSTT